MDSKQVIFPVLYLNQLPGAMDKMGWTVGAKMMRKWFSNPAWRMDRDERGGYFKGSASPIIYSSLPVSQIDETIIKMSWVLKYPQAQSAYQFLRSNWNSHDGRIQLVRRLKRYGWQPGMTHFQLGSINDKASVIDNLSQVNRKPFGEYSDTLDDFYSAIFRATMKVALVGYTEFDDSLKKDFFVVQYEGYYIRDTYDFNSGWWEDAAIGLGIWSRDRVLDKAETLEYMTLISKIAFLPEYVRALIKYAGFVHVKNSDFYRWMDKHGEGGDFYVFSDVLWEYPQNGTLKIELPS
jgi:hypothetical protein